MSFKIGDKENSFIISKNETIRSKNSTINTLRESLKLNLKPVTQDYRSKTDFSKLLKGSKIIDNQIDLTSKDTEKDTLIEKTINTAKDENTLSIASSVLSAVKIPQAEPIKLTVNILTSDKKIQNLAHDIEADNYSGIVNNSVDFARSGLGSVVGVAKITEWGTGIVADLGILSKTGKFATKVNTITGSVVSVAAKVSIPFSVIGTGMSALDIRTANNKVQMKKAQIKALNIAVASSNNPNSVNANKAKKQLKSELTTLKVNTGLKSVAFGLSAISTATLIASVKNPSKAKTYATVSLVTSIASSVTSVIADDKVRSKISGLFK